MCSAQDQHIELLFYKLDQNHDNVIDLQEFIDGYDQYMSLVTNGTFLNSTRELVDKHMLTTDDAIPAGAEMVTNWSGGKIKLYKSTYPANDPSEDRSTLVIGDDFLWCGVWDGAQPASRISRQTWFSPHQHPSERAHFAYPLQDTAVPRARSSRRLGSTRTSRRLSGTLAARACRTHLRTATSPPTVSTWRTPAPIRRLCSRAPALLVRTLT